MKITKNTTPVSEAKPVNSSSKLDAQKHIKAAIDCLGKAAKEDIVAQESIANLSVVLLDLQ